MAINGFDADDLVVCTYRLPNPLQPWVGSFHVGRVLEAGEDPAEWNGYNSERDYCQRTNRVPVLYCQDYPCTFCQPRAPFHQHDDANALIKIVQEQATLPLADKLRLFLGEEALARYRDSSRPWPPEQRAETAEPPA